jgi:cyclopropane fatty-acyl-phospholipid synthase-like methyltransferase
MRRVSGATPAVFWDSAARDNAAWYVATGYTVEDSGFFAQAAAETDRYLAFCDVAIRPDDTILEIGCGVGRMTHRLAELAARVIAADVSEGDARPRCEESDRQAGRRVRPGGR